MQIAIDGPAGSGKSTVAKQVARDLGFLYIDTGAMYRAVALYCLESFIDLKEPQKIADAIDEIEITFETDETGQKVFLNEIEVTEEIRMEHVGAAASGYVARATLAREKLVEKQRQIASGQDVVMDGRDIGSVVLKDADIKLFLTAQPSTRAKRRYDELVSKGESPDLEEITAEVIARDERDTDPSVGSLVILEETQIIDTTQMSVAQVIEQIKLLVANKR